MKYRLILASGSPRRKELLSLINEKFEIIVSDVDENIEAKSPDELVMKLSNIKAQSVMKEIEALDAIVIGADTVVAIDNEILGKPKDKNEAYNMIEKIQGRFHNVYTGVTILSGDGEEKIHQDCFAVCTKVYVNDMNREEINEYICTSEPYDKAGGYGIQGLFSKYIKGIEGDYFNVVGFPVSEVYKRIKNYEFK